MIANFFNLGDFEKIESDMLMLNIIINGITFNFIVNGGFHGFFKYWSILAITLLF